jgi:hypothetical protein
MVNVTLCYDDLCRRRQMLTTRNAVSFNASARALSQKLIGRILLMVKVTVHFLHAMLSRWWIAVKCRHRCLLAPMLKTSSAYRSLHGICYRPA